MSQISTDLTDLPPEILQQLSHTPAIPVPQGVISNFTDPYTEKNVQIISTSVILVLMILFFLNRVYTKVLLMKRVTWDDGTLLVAFACCITYYIACTWGAEKGGYGTHLWDMSILRAASLNLLVPSYIVSVITPLTFLFLKCTFFILYLELFGTVTWLLIASWVGLVATFLIYTIFTIMVFVWATPKRGQTWLSHQTSPEMHKELSLSVPQSVVGLVIDLYILLIPIIGVYGLRLSTKRKIGVMLIFFSGTLACICSACSIYYRKRLDSTADATFALIPVNISTLAEMFVGVICACMPSAAYAFRHQDSLYHHLLRSVSVRVDSLRSKYGSKYASSASRESSQMEKSIVQPASDILKSTDRKYAQYFSTHDHANSISQSQLNEKTSLSATIDLPAIPSATASIASRTSSNDSVSPNHHQLLGDQLV